MKIFATLALVAGLTMQLSAEPVFEDIVTYEALVTDAASGATLASGGPWDWDWDDVSSQSMLGSMAGPGRTIVVICRNAAGEAIFGGMITADLTVPPSPFEPPNPFGQVTLTFYTADDIVSVFLNNRYFVGELVLLPVEDDAVLPVVVDIKPGSDQNPFNTRSQGVLPVVVLGSPELDVSQIVPASVKLAGVSPVRLAFDDLQADGFSDAILHFRSQDVAAVLAGVADGEVVELELTGTLLDGTAIGGSDTLTVILPKKKK